MLGVLPIPAASPIVPEQGGIHSVFIHYSVVGAGHGSGHPPQVESPLLLDTGYLSPAGSPGCTALGCRSRPSRTTTGTGLDIDLTSSLADESTGTRRARISGAGCQGATPTTRYKAGLPPVRARSSLSTSTSRRLSDSLASGSSPS